MTSLSVQIIATTTRVHVTSTQQQQRSTATPGFALCSHGTLAMRTYPWMLVDTPQHESALLRRLWVGQYDHRTHDTTRTTTRQRSWTRRLRPLPQGCRHECWLGPLARISPQHPGPQWNRLAEHVVDDQGKGAGGSLNHQQASMTHMRVARREFVGKCANNDHLDSSDETT